MTTTRWVELSADPNSREARAHRKAQLKTAARPGVADRIGYLTELAKGKRVLDVGVVAHFLEAEASDDWLHGHIAAAADYCLGIDILAEPVEKLQSHGYNVRCCDITTEAQEIDDVFDLIICGELIEHIGSPQALFASAASLLAPGGRIVMTTPNPYYLARVVRALRGRFEDSVDHVTLLYPSGIAEMAEREGLALDRYAGVPVPSGNFRSAFGRLAAIARPVLCRLGITYMAFCDTMIYECVLPAPTKTALNGRAAT